MKNIKKNIMKYTETMNIKKYKVKWEYLGFILFQNLRARLVWAIILPVFGVLGFSSVLIYQNLEERSKIQKNVPLMQLISHVTYVMDRLQQERARAVLLPLTHYSAQATQNFEYQATQTDPFIDAYMASLRDQNISSIAPDLNSLFQSIHGALGRLKRIRQNILEG